MSHVRAVKGTFFQFLIDFDRLWVTFIGFEWLLLTSIDFLLIRLTQLTFFSLSLYLIPNQLNPDKSAIKKALLPSFICRLNPFKLVRMKKPKRDSMWVSKQRLVANMQTTTLRSVVDFGICALKVSWFGRTIVINQSRSSVLLFTCQIYLCDVNAWQRN